MRRMQAGVILLLAVLVAWDLRSAFESKALLIESAAICATAIVSAYPAIRWTAARGLRLRLWSFLARRVTPYATPGLLLLSHLFAKDQPASALIATIVFFVLLLCLHEALKWSAYTLSLGDGATSDADAAWARALASRYVPLSVLAIGLSISSMTLSLGFTGTWTVLALSVLFIVIVVFVARSASRPA